MDRDSDEDEPPLRTREAAKRAPKLIRTRDPVDTMVWFHPLLSADRQLTRPNPQCFQPCLDDSQRSKEQSWVKNIGSSNSAGVYQGPSGGAVTAAGARAKGRSSRMATKPSNPREERRKPVKGESMLVGALRKGKTC